MHDFLADNVTLRLFAVIGLGYLLGKLRLGGFSLGVAGVLFVGLAFGAWGQAAFEIPHVVATLGLALFVYTIGLASGPGVVRALTSKEGLRLSLLTAVSVLAAAGVTLAGIRLAGIPQGEGAGLFCGALTNTPALAAQIEMLERRPGADVEAPVVGYSLAYPFGVLGVFLVLALLTRTTSPSEELERYERLTGTTKGPVFSRNYRVTQLKPNGNQLEVDWVREHTGLVISRRLHESHLDVVEADSVLALGDVVLAVGTAEMHEQGGPRIGEPVQDQHLEAQHGEVTYRRFFVTNKELIGRPLGEVQLQGATITRVRRGDLEMPASPGLRLSEGDIVRVVTRVDNVDAVARFFGDSLSELAHTDYLSVSLGMVLGVLIGSLPIPLGAQPYPSLGVAGGCLLVALILGKLQRSGSIVWTLSLEANLALREIGLLFFLATVGVRAGGEFAEAMAGNGPLLIAWGALITLTSAGTLALGGRLLLKQNLVPLLGVISGAHTQPACLAYANSLVDSEGVNVGYAAVFPVAMIVKIVLATALLSL